MKIWTNTRPYVMHAPSGAHVLLTSEEAQRLLDAYPAAAVTPHRVVLRGPEGGRTTVRPATVGGGPAFTWARQRRH